MANVQTVETGSTGTPEAVKSPSKADVARGIFVEMKGSPRKDVIARFISEAKLTKAGAATYYQNFKSKGL